MKKFCKFANAALAAKKRRSARRVASIFAALLLFALAFVSCDNSSSDNAALFAAIAQAQSRSSKPKKRPADNPEASGEQGAKTITFTGNIGGSEGAIPAKMSAQLCAQASAAGASGVSKSAVPGIDTGSSGYEWFATATADGADEVHGDFGTTAADSRSFSMALQVGRTWKIVCGVRAAGGGSVMEDSYDFDARADNPVLLHTFVLTPKKSGSGSIALSVSVDSSVATAVALCFDDDWKEAAPAGPEKPLDLTASPALLSVGSIKSGSYDITLNFFADDGSGGRVYLYSAPQTINVFDNAETDMWVSSGGTGTLAAGSDGKTTLVVNGDEIKSSGRTMFYVCDADSAEALGGAAPSDSNSGSAYEPLESLGRAAQIIAATGNSSNKKNYKIFIGGSVLCNDSLGAGLDDVASSVTISGLGVSGADVLQGSGASTSVVTVATKAPVTIKGLDITGGKGSSGAGVNISTSGAKLVLASGTKVYGNTGDTGGGVSVCSGASLEILDGSEISGNSARSGGGVYIASSAGAVMKGGLISANTGGDIGAGGVQNHGSFAMSGGTIENNSANYVGAVSVEEGSTFNVSGSASIPYGVTSDGVTQKGEGKNDVFLAAITGGNGAVETITVAGSLSASGCVATLHPKDWPRGKQVLAAGGSVSSLSDAILEKFSFTDTDFHVNRNKTNASQGLLVGDIYVAGSGYRHCLAAGSDADGVTGTKNAPFASIGHAASKIVDGGKNTILVDGSLASSDDQNLASDFLTSNCSELTIKGWGDATHPALDDDGIPVNQINAGGSGIAFKTESAVPIVMQNIKVTGGSNTLGNGGGIYIASGSSVTLGAGALVAGNEAKFGGGVFVAGDLLIDGGTIGDAGATDHATRSVYSNKAVEKGGGVCFNGTGKVTLKSGIVAYNYAVRGGGIATNNESYYATSQMTLEGGEVRRNCSQQEDGLYNWNACGGGLFLKGCKFSFTGGDVHHNYGTDGGGGIFLETTNASDPAVMSGGSVHDNEYYVQAEGEVLSCKWGTDLLLFNDAILNMSGGRIYSETQREYGVEIRSSTCALRMSGSATIDKKTPVLVGEICYDAGHDSYTYNWNYVTIADTLTQPDPDDDTVKNAYIVPPKWKRGEQVLKASDSALIADNIDRFATIDEDFLVEQTPGVAKGVLNAPIYIAGSGKSSDVTGSPSDADDTRGTRSSPYASLKYALEKVCDDGDVDYKIFVSGSINDGSEIPSSGFSAKSLTIEGYYQDSTGSTSMNDRLRGVTTAGSEKPALTVNSTVPVTIKSLGIFGGYRTNLDTSSSPCGGGIYIPKEGAHVTLAKGSCVGSNSFKASSNASLGYGAGIYIAAGASVYMCQSALVTSNYAGKGGGIYNAGNLYLGYKYENGARGEEELTGGVKNNGDTGDGSGIYTVGKFLMKSGSVSSNKGHHGAGIYSEAASDDDAQILGGSVQSNQACFEGGGFYVKAGGHLRIEDCEIKGNTTQYQDSSRFGGGAYSKGVLRLGKKANFQNGTTGEYKNDIALDGDDGKIIVEEAFEQTGLVARLSLGESYIRGKVLLEPASTLTSGITTAIAEQFSIVDPDFSIAVKGSGSSATGVAHAPTIYLASNATPDDARRTCDVKGNEWTSARGTKRVPYARMSQALSQLRDESVNYVIKVDGTIRSTSGSDNFAQAYFDFTDSSAIKAASVVLEGANGDNSFDILNASFSTSYSNRYVLRLAGSVPLTIKNLKITGGYNKDEGGGIRVEDGATLVLDEGALVEGNRSAKDGAGIYAGGTVKVVSAATVWDNKKGSGDDAPASNIYLPADKKIIVDGALSKGTAKAKIGVSCADAPVVGTPVVFTEGYGFNSGGKNESVYPGSYFSGDKYAVALDSALVAAADATGDGALAIGGGGITVEDLYKDVSITASRSIVNVSAEDSDSRRIKFTAKISQNGSTSTLTPGGSSSATTSGKIYYSDCKVYNHGEEVPQSGNYSLSYVLSDKIGYIQFTADMPAGTYMAHVTGVSEGRKYGASFEVKVVKNQVKDFDTDPSVNHKTPARTYGGGSGGSSATYIYLGDYPQTLKADDVEVYNVSSNKKTRGTLAFYPGSDGNWYAQKSSKWYKLEPIKWRVLTKSYKDSNGNDVWLLLSEKILDAETFFNYYSRSGSSSSYYAASCYYFSIARAFLDATSYLDSDCSTDNREYQNYTTDNSGKSFRIRALRGAPLKPVSLPNTEAAVKREDGTGSSPSSSALGAVTYRNASAFILSRQEATRTYYDFNGGEGADPARVRTATDWAEASGATSGKWVTRSMSSSSSCYGYDSTGAEITCSVTSGSKAGLVPAICIAPMN